MTIRRKKHAFSVFGCTFIFGGYNHSTSVLPFDKTYKRKIWPNIFFFISNTIKVINRNMRSYLREKGKNMHFSCPLP
jgi:hypothetical protein